MGWTWDREDDADETGGGGRCATGTADVTGRLGRPWSIVLPLRTMLSVGGAVELTGRGVGGQPYMKWAGDRSFRVPLRRLPLGICHQSTKCDAQISLAMHSKWTGIAYYKSEENVSTLCFRDGGSQNVIPISSSEGSLRGEVPSAPDSDLRTCADFIRCLWRWRWDIRL